MTISPVNRGQIQGSPNEQNISAEQLQSRLNALERQFRQEGRPILVSTNFSDIRAAASKLENSNLSDTQKAQLRGELLGRITNTAHAQRMLNGNAAESSRLIGELTRENNRFLRIGRGGIRTSLEQNLAQANRANPRFIEIRNQRGRELNEMLTSLNQLSPNTTQRSSQQIANGLTGQNSTTDTHLVNNDIQASSSIDAMRGLNNPLINGVNRVSNTAVGRGLNAAMSPIIDPVMNASATDGWRGVETGLRFAQARLADGAEATVNAMTLGQAPELGAAAGGGLRQLSSITEYFGQRAYGGERGREQAGSVLRRQTLDNLAETTGNIATARVGGQVTRYFRGGASSSLIRQGASQLVGRGAQYVARTAVRETTSIALNAAIGEGSPSPQSAPTYVANKIIAENSAELPRTVQVPSLTAPEATSTAPTQVPPAQTKLPAPSSNKNYLANASKVQDQKIALKGLNSKANESKSLGSKFSGIG